MAASCSAQARDRPKTSKTWEHFTLDKVKQRITCNICKMDFAWHGSTTTMHEHLKRRHVGVLEDKDSPRLASGSTDGLVNVFDLTKGAEEDALVATCNSESSVSALCWLGRGQGRREQTRLLCVSHDEGLKLWDLESLETEGELTVYSTQDARTTIGHNSTAGSAVDYLIGGCWLDSEGQLLVVGGSGGGDIHLFTCDKPGLNLVRTLRAGHRATVRSFGFDSQSVSLFTGGEDGALLRWSPEERSGGVSETEVESSRQEQSRQEQRKPESLKSDSVMRLKSRPHKKHKFNRDKKPT